MEHGTRNMGQGTWDKEHGTRNIAGTGYMCKGRGHIGNREHRTQGRNGMHGAKTFFLFITN